MGKKKPLTQEAVQAEIERLRLRKDMMLELLDAAVNQEKRLATAAAADALAVAATPRKAAAIARALSPIYRSFRTRLRNSSIEERIKRTRLYRWIAKKGIIYRIATGRR